MARPHIPALDGLRGIAVLLVMAFHFLFFSLINGVPAPQGPAAHALYRFVLVGWCGVDLFFVLSGFLITRILLETKNAPGYFRSFYARRALRIFPLYFLTLLLWLLFTAISPLASKFPGAPGNAVWLWTYLTNIYIALKGWAAIPLPLQHLWTLALEEQFYLAWPLFVFLLRKRTAIALCIAAVIASPLFRLYFALNGNSEFGSLLTPGRIDGLALGCLLALAGSSLSRAWFRAAGAVCFVAIGSISLVLGRFTATDPLTATLGLSLVAVFFAALVGICAYSETPPWRPLAAVPLTWMGKRSYCLYLVHQPVCILLLGSGWLRELYLRNSWVGPGMVLVVFAICFTLCTLLAEASYRGLELRLAGWKQRWV